MKKYKTEIWDLFDENRKPLDMLHTRGDRMPEGKFHIVTEVWTVNSHGEILITLRDPKKDIYPDLWENTGGSALTGESSRKSAVRELFEETGIKAKEHELVLLGTKRGNSAFVDTYIIKKDVLLGNLKMQKGETVEAKWVSLDALEDMIEKGLLAMPVVERLDNVKKEFVNYIKGIKKMIETHNLLLRKFTSHDTFKIYQLSQEDGMKRWLPDQVYKDINESNDVIEYLISLYNEKPDPLKYPFVLGIELKNSRELIGHVGLSPFNNTAEIGYAIEEKYQGKGYGTEAISAMKEWGLKELGLKGISAVVDLSNKGSLRVLEKTGFILFEEKERKHFGKSRVCRVYKVKNNLCAKSERITLYYTDKEDKKLIFDMLMEPEIADLVFGGENKPLTWDEYKDKENEFYSGDENMNNYLLIAHEGQIIGAVSHSYNEAKIRNMEIDIWMGKKTHTGKGLGVETLNTLTEYLHKKYCITTFIIRPWIKNSRAVRAYQKAGFLISENFIPEDYYEHAGEWLKGDYGFEETVNMVKIIE